MSFFRGVIRKRRGGASVSNGHGIAGSAPFFSVPGVFAFKLAYGITSGKVRLVVDGAAQTASTVTGASGTVSLTPPAAGASVKAQLLDSTATIILAETSNWSLGDVSHVLTALGLSGLTFSTSNAAGTVIGNITGAYPGAVVSVLPADGRVIVSPDGTQLMVGLSASVAGTIGITLRQTDATASNGPTLDSNFTLTVSTPASVGQVTGITVADVLQNGMLLQWSAPSDGFVPADYKIELSTDNGVTWSTFTKLSTSVVTYEWVIGLSTATAYKARVTAVDASNVSGTPSVTASFTTSGAPSLSLSNYASAVTKAAAAFSASNKPNTTVLADNTIVTPGVNLAASRINGATAANLASAIAVPDSPSGNANTTASVYINRVSHQASSSQGWSKLFSFTGSKFDFRVACNGSGGLGAQVKVRYSEDNVNWCWTSAQPVGGMPTGSNAYWVLVDFDQHPDATKRGSRLRYIEVVFGYGTTPSGFGFGAGTVGTVPTVDSNALRLAMWLDSYTFGSYVYDFTGTMNRSAAEALGSHHIFNQGLRGNRIAGLSRTSSVYDAVTNTSRTVVGAYPCLSDRLRNTVFDEVTIRGALDVVFLNGTINDGSISTLNPTLLKQYTVNVLQLLRKYQPSALIVFSIGIAPPNSQNTANHNTAYRDAFTQALGTDPGAKLLDGAALSWAPAGAIGSSPYFPGSSTAESDYATLNGTSLADLQGHPNDAGHAYFGGLIGNGAGAWVNTLSALMSPPGQVTGLAAGAPTYSSVPLSWTAPAGVPSDYLVEYSSNGGTTWLTFADGTSAATSVTVTGLAASTAHLFRVSAVNASGTGIVSATASATTAAAPAVPGQPATFVPGAATATTQPLSWTAPSTGGAVASYTLDYRLTGAGSWTNWATGLTGLSSTITGLSPSTAYDFRLTAVNVTGSGTPATATATTAAAPAVPGQPATLTTGTATATTQPLSWTAPSTGGAVVSYTLDYKLTSAGSWTAFATGLTGTSATVTGLVASTSYDYRITAVNATGSGTPRSATASTAAAPSAAYVLREDGSYVLREDGSRIIREQL